MKTLAWCIGFAAVALVLLSPALREQAEVLRIQVHLAGAEWQLRSASTDGLVPAQRRARARNIELLRSYGERGVFPHNTDHPGKRMPTFIDHRGVPCAMAYLVACSGRGDLVARIRATRNDAFIRELAGDPALGAWLHEAGLTVAEAARVQPSYGPRRSSDSVSSDYAVLTALAGVTNGGMIAWNLSKPPPSHGSGSLGVLVGGLTVILGAERIDNGTDDEYLGLFNVVVGGMSMIPGTTRLFGEHAPKTSEVVESPHPSLAIVPVVGRTTGLAVTLDF